MNLDHLRYFRDAANLGSLSSAARENRVSQSAISQAILKIEAALGEELLAHQQNAFELTEAGHAVLRECQKVFDSIDNLRNSLKAQDRGAIRGEVTVASSTSVATSLLAGKCARLSKLHPNIRLKLRLGNSEIVREWVLEKKVDFGIVIDSVKDDRFKRQKLASGYFGLYQSAHFSGDWTKDGIFVTRHERPEVQSLRKAYLKSFGAELPIQMEITSWEVMKGFILSGTGAGLLPDYVAAEEVARRRMRPLKAAGSNQPYSIDVLRLKAKTPTTSARLTLDIFCGA